MVTIANVERRKLDAGPTLSNRLAGRVLPFDCAAARAYGDIAAARRSLGRPIPEADCQIAAIARSATRRL